MNNKEKQNFVRKTLRNCGECQKLHFHILVPLIIIPNMQDKNLAKYDIPNIKKL